MKRLKTEVSLKGTAWIEFHKFSCFLTIHSIPQDKVNAKNEKADIIGDVKFGHKIFKLNIFTVRECILSKHIT